MTMPTRMGNQYQDFALCDVIPVMHDREAIHNGQENTYSVHGDDLAVTLMPKIRDRADDPNQEVRDEVED